MKVALIFLATVLAIAAATPYIKPTVVDWERAHYELTEMRTIIGTAVVTIKEVSMKANETIGKIISDELDAKRPIAAAIFNQTEKEINEMTLTAAQARGYFEMLDTLIIKLRETLAEVVAQLPKGVEDQILDLVEKTYIKAGQKASLIIQILSDV